MHMHKASCINDSWEWGGVILERQWEAKSQVFFPLQQD